MAVEIKIPATLELREQGTELRLVIKCRVADVNRTLYVKPSDVTNINELLEGVKCLCDFTSRKVSEEILDEIDVEAAVQQAKAEQAKEKQDLSDAAAENKKKVRTFGL